MLNAIIYNDPESAEEEETDQNNDANNKWN